MPYVATSNLFAPNFSWSCPFGVCHDIIFLVATNNCFSAWQFCRDRGTTELPLSRQDFFKSLAIFYRDKKLFDRDRLFFSGSCHLLSCLSRHRIICCNTIALAILKSSSISVVAYFSLVETKFYIPSLLLLRHRFCLQLLIMSQQEVALFPFFLCCSSASCHNREFTSFMFCLSRQN